MPQSRTTSWPIITRSRGPQAAPAPAPKASVRRYVSHWSTSFGQHQQFNYSHLKFKMTTGYISETGQISLTTSDEILGIDIAADWKKGKSDGQKGTESESGFLGEGYGKVAIRVRASFLSLNPSNIQYLFPRVGLEIKMLQSCKRRR